MSDSDLDDEILQGLGLGQGTKRPRRAADSDSEPDDDEDDYAPTPAARSTAGGARGGSKAGGSLKKRRTDDEGSGDEDGYGSDLYFDEDDRAKLAAMTQLEREMVLAERAEKLIDEKERRNLLAGGKKPATQEVDARGATTGRGKPADAKRSAMDKIKAAREKKAQATKRREERDDDEYAISDEEEVSDVSGAGVGGGMGEYGYGTADRDRAADRGRPYDSAAAERRYDDTMTEAAEDDEEATWEEVKLVQIRRQKLEAWVKEPFFERCVAGCVVRLSVPARDKQTGQPKDNYLVAVVAEVEERPPGRYKDVPGGRPWDSPYPLGPGKTSKWIKVRRGSSEKVFPMALVSNSSITEDEFDRWVRQCARDRVVTITRQEVDHAKTRLQQAENYVYSATDIKTMLEAKRSKGLVLGSVAAERARLESLKAAALEVGNMEEAAEHEATMVAIEARYNAGPRDGRVAIGEINRKNADRNFRNMLHNVSNHPEAKRSADAEYEDRFSRRKTRPQVYFAPAQKIKEGGTAAGQATAQVTPSKPQRAPGGRQRLDPERDVLGVDIDLSLLELRTNMPSVALDLLGPGWQDTLFQAARGGPGGMAGGKAARPEKVLTLNDYKRRQGLM